MALKYDELPKEVRDKLKGKGVQPARRQRMLGAEINRHAIAVAALLRDSRQLSQDDAKRVLNRALLIV